MVVRKPGVQMMGQQGWRVGRVGGLDGKQQQYPLLCPQSVGCPGKNIQQGYFGWVQSSPGFFAKFHLARSSSCLSVINSLRMRLLLLRDCVLKRASFRYFCFEID